MAYWFPYVSDLKDAIEPEPKDNDEHRNILASAKFLPVEVKK